MSEIKMEGLSELLKALKELPKVIDEKCLKVSVFTGSNVIKRAAADLVLRRTGLTGKAVRVAFNKKESGPGKKVYHVYVSPKVKMVYDLRTDKYKGKSIRAFWWWWLEFGTVKRSAKPFMRPAFDTTSREAAEVIKGKLKERIEIEAERLGRR